MGLGDKDILPLEGVEAVAGREKGIALPGVPAAGHRVRGGEVCLTTYVFWFFRWI